MTSNVDALFSGEPDAMEVLRWKELYDALQHALAECRSVQNLLSSRVLLVVMVGLVLAALAWMTQIVRTYALGMLGGAVLVAGALLAVTAG